VPAGGGTATVAHSSLSPPRRSFAVQHEKHAMLAVVSHDRAFKIDTITLPLDTESATYVLVGADWAHCQRCVPQQSNCPVGNKPDQKQFSAWHHDSYN
jgi:hypothetical protein